MPLFKRGDHAAVFFQVSHNSRNASVGKSKRDTAAEIPFFIINKDQIFLKREVGQKGILKTGKNLAFIQSGADEPRYFLKGVKAAEPFIQLFLGLVEVQVRFDDQFCLFIQVVKGIL